MFEQAVHFQKRGLELDQMILERELTNSRAIRPGVLSENQYDTRNPEAVVIRICIRYGPSGGWIEEVRTFLSWTKSGLLMTNLITELFPPEEPFSNFCMRTGSIAKPCLLEPKDFNFFRCKADDFCTSESAAFISEAFKAPDLQHWFRY